MLHLLWIFILLPSRGWNYTFHNHDTKVEKDTLINEDDAHKVFFRTSTNLLKIFYMWQNLMNLQVHCHKTDSHSSQLNWVRDSQNSDFDENTIANEDGKHFDVKMPFSSKWAYLAVFSWSLDNNVKDMYVSSLFLRFKISLSLCTKA